MYKVSATLNTITKATTVHCSAAPTAVRFVCSQVSKLARALDPTFVVQLLNEDFVSDLVSTVKPLATHVSA